MIKKLTLLAITAFFITFSFAQTYSFSKLIKKASVQTSTGTQYKVIATLDGPYRFVFETPNDPQIKRLFTLLKPGQQNEPGLPWFGQIKEQGFIEIKNTLFRKSIYYDTENREQVVVLIAEDYSQIIIFKNDDTVWEFTR